MPKPTQPAATEATTQSPHTTGRQKLLLIFFSVSLVVLGLGAFEGLLALLGLGQVDRFPDPFVGFEGSTTLFEQSNSEEGQAVYATRPAKLTFFNHQEFPVEKSAGTLRIFTLGGSTTAGRPYDDHVSFARWLERYLDAAEPGRPHEVINAGAISYASYRVVLLMKELVKYQPDAFVVYTGHNEFLEERTYRDRPKAKPVIDGLRQKLGGLRVASLLRQAVGKAEEADSDTQLGDEVKTRLDVWTGLAAYERDDDLAGSIVEHFAFNLEQMVALAEAHDVALVFVAPASNVKDFSPFKSDFGTNLPVAEQERVMALLAAGRTRLTAGDPQGATESLQAALTLDPDYAETHFRLGQAHFAADDAESAQAAFLRAKELDIAPLRAREDLVNLVAETAARHKLPWVDLPTLLAEQMKARFGHSILGSELFLDHVHPDLTTQSLIAEQVMAKLADLGLVQLDGQWSEEGRVALFEEVVGQLDRDYYAQRDLNLAKVLGWAGKLEEAEAPLRRAAEELEGVADFHLNLGTLLQKTGRLDEAAEELEKAVALLPEQPEARFNLGVVYGRLGRLEEGIAALEEAVRQRPEYAEAHHNLGLLLSRGGRSEAALAALERSRTLAPESPEVHRALGRTLRLARRMDAAIGAFRESLKLAPRSTATRVELATTLAEAGQIEAALESIERTVSLDPTDPEAHYNHGLLLNRAGRPEAALAAYRQALALDPNRAVVHNNLGILLARTGDLAAGAQHLNRAVELDPTFGEAYLNLGVVEDRSGRPEQAVAAIERSLELNPEEPRAHLALAMLYTAQGQREAALPHLEAARQGGLEIPAGLSAGVD